MDHDGTTVEVCKTNVSCFENIHVKTFALLVGSKVRKDVKVEGSNASLILAHLLE